MSKKEQTTPVMENGQAIVAEPSFFEKNLKKVAIVAGSVLAAVIVYVLATQYYIAPRNAKAADEIAVAEQLFIEGNYEQALNGDGVNSGFLQVIEQYGSTPSGNLARLYAGLCYAHTDKAEEAVKYLEQFDACDDMMVSNAAIAALGNCYAQIGQNEKAAATLVKAAKRADNNVQSALYYLQAGEIFEALGNKVDALKCYEIIKSTYPQSYQSQEIDKYIERVK